MSEERMRCFVEREGASWKAYCVEVNLSATGNTSVQARAELDRLLERYCYDLYEGKALTSRVGRPAPALRVKYWAARLLAHDTPPGARQCYDFHAPPQLLVGLA